MKKITLIAVLLLSLLLLAACAAAATSGSETASQSGAQSDAQSGNGQDFANQPLSQPLQLAIGTLKLEDTALKLDASQAAALLPLWQAYESLSASSTAAQVEVDAVLEQVQEAMTTEQLKAIEDMQLTGASMGEVFQSLGLETGFNGQGQFSGTPDPERRATIEASGGFQGGRGGDFPAGGPPGDGAVGVGPGGGGGFGPGGGFAAGGTPDPELLATRQARVGGFAGGGRLNPALFQALIDLLQTRSEQKP